MNRIKEIHAGDFVAVVETRAGVLCKRPGRRWKNKGCIIPPADPASRANCSVGGTRPPMLAWTALRLKVWRDAGIMSWGLQAVLADLPWSHWADERTRTKLAST